MNNNAFIIKQLCKAVKRAHEDYGQELINLSRVHDWTCIIDIFVQADLDGVDLEKVLPAKTRAGNTTIQGRIAAWMSVALRSLPGKCARTVKVPNKWAVRTILGSEIVQFRTNAKAMVYSVK